MADDTWMIDPTSCKRCGSCCEVCPNRIFDKDQSGAVFVKVERTWSCIRCGQCMAVCSTQAMHVPGLSYERDFFPLPDISGDDCAEYFTQLISTRRAVRAFQDRPVPHELLEQVVQAIQFAPPGFPPVKTELIVVEDPDVIRQSLPDMIDFYVYLLNAMRNPIKRLFIRLDAGKEAFTTLRQHVVPLMTGRLPDLQSGKEDTILRHAPALILFHADRKSENYRADAYVALTYGFLAAHSLGLGATPLDLVPPAVEHHKGLRRLFKIPDGHEVVAALILGFPKVKYQRGIRRELKSVTWI